METTVAPTDVSSIIDETKRDLFLDQGFIRLDHVIEEDERQWLLGLYDELFDSNGRKQLGGVDEQGRETLPQILGPHQKVPELFETRYHQRIAAIAESLLGETPDQVGTHMILKPANYGVATPWHQDQAYHPSHLNYRNINFWLPLEEATVENGCMQFVPDTHKGPVLPHTWLVPGDKTSAMVAVAQDYWQANAVAVPCPAGSVTLHHSYMMHSAGPNRTDQPRRAYITVFKAKATRRERPWVFPWMNQGESA